MSLSASSVAVVLDDLAAGDLRGLPGALFVDVADGDDFEVVGLLHLDQRAHVPGGHAAASDDADAQALVGALHLPVAAGGHGAGRAQECPSR